jgi:L-ascorbate metabolism protein UlaG (beta-lactamase superfamily)
MNRLISYYGSGAARFLKLQEQSEKFSIEGFSSEEEDDMSLGRDTRITYLGHSTLLIESSEGTRIVIDPFLAGNPSCPEAWKSVASLGKVDIILLTHIHNDHAADALALAAANPGAPVAAVYEATHWLGSHGITNTRPMNTGGTITIGSVSVSMTLAFHSSSFQEEDGRIVYGGVAAGFVVGLENGFTFYAAGDTALFGDMKLIREIYSPELAFLPIGDGFTMGPRDAAIAARLLGVKHVVPIHYATFPGLTGTPESLAEHASGIENLTIHVIKPGETLT